ncbi:MAG: LuxR C-terminal-related transcriptional regulator [Allosphingosinicella sp.]
MADSEETGFAGRLIASIALSPIATVVTDPNRPDNPIVAVNAAFTQLTGYSAGEAVGRNCRFLAGPDTDPLGQAVLRAGIEQGRSALAELLNYRKDGSRFRNAVMIAPVLGPDGTVAFFIGSQMNVSEEAGGPAAFRRQRAAEMVSALTPRQRQVLEQMIRGLRNKQIAAALGIDEKTVKMHRAGMLRRLRAPTSADAIRIGVEAGL